MTKSKNKNKAQKVIFVDDERTKFFTISHCYPLNFNWVYHEDRKSCAQWLAEIIGSAPLFRMWHRPNSRAMILIEIEKKELLGDSEQRLIGEHRWNEILKDPQELEETWKSKIFHSLYNTPEAAIKDGWNPVDIEDDWFEGWQTGMTRFKQPYPMSHWCAIVAPDTTGKQICHHLPAKIKPQPPRAPQPVVGSSNWTDTKTTAAPIPPTPLAEIQASKPTSIITQPEMPTLQEASRQLKVLNGSKSPRSLLSPHSLKTPLSAEGGGSNGEARGSKWGNNKQEGRLVPGPMSIQAAHSVGFSKPSPSASAWGKPITFSMSSGGKNLLPFARPPPSPHTWSKRPNLVPDRPKTKPKVEEDDDLAKWTVDTPSSEGSAAITPAGSGDNTPQIQPPTPLPTVEAVASAGPAWQKPLRTSKANKAQPPKPNLPQISAYASLADSDDDDDAGVFLNMAGALSSAVGHEPYLPENHNVDHLTFPGVHGPSDITPMPNNQPARPEPEDPLVCPTHGLNACKKGVCKDMNQLYMKREGNKKRLEEEKDRKKKLENAKLKKREQDKRLEDERKKQEEEKLRQQQALRATDEDEEDEDEEEEDQQEGYKPFSYVQGLLSKGRAAQPPRNTNVAAAAAKGKGREVMNDPREGKLRAFEEEPQASEDDASSVEYNEEDLF